MTTSRALLFVHGIRNDDPYGAWRNALDSSLRRVGAPTVGEQGYDVLTPSYLDLLERESEPDAERPGETYKRHNDAELRRAAKRYWLALDQLQSAGIREHAAAPSVLAKLPAHGPPADLARNLLFEQANRYRRSGNTRNAVLQRVLAPLPDEGELVIIAHSLGSVVARDLIYHVPPRLRVRLLITIGTPLALKPMREHLQDGNRRFPYEIMGPWINIVGAGDAVTGFRGLSQIYGQALDVFVDTGRFRAAHRASAYLANPTAAIALDWLNKPPAAPDDDALLPDQPLPRAVLSLIVGTQYALRLGQAITSRAKRDRFDEARQLVLASVSRQIADTGLGRVSAAQLSSDNGAWLRTKPVGDDEAVAYLLSALTGNPVAPYEIEVAREERLTALKALARDLGKPEHFATILAQAEAAARASHKESRITLLRAAIAVAGVAVVAAAPALVLVAAPAGLAGGAAIVAGLAALGPGGMLGGVGIVGALGGVGGLTAGRALIAGDAAQVEETVIFLQAFARTRHELREADIATIDRDYREWYALIEMEDAAADDCERLKRFSDDDAPGVKELERKLRAIDRALRWLREEGLAPVGLPRPAAERE